MKVLIVEGDPGLGELWAKHLRRAGHDVVLVESAEAAIAAMSAHAPDVIVADLDLPGNAALGVADFAAYRHPGAKVVFVTASRFFSDGAIFDMSVNACAFLPAGTTPEDLAIVVEFHAAQSARES